VTRDLPVSTSLPMTRRRLLMQALALLPLSACVSSVDRALGTNTVRGWTRSLFPDPQAATMAGRLYLARWPEEESASWLAHVLFGTQLSRQVNGGSEDRLWQHVRSACDRDFCTDDLVTLNGWVVTRTEARLLALLSLCSDE
jgi:hypothetical protein